MGEERATYKVKRTPMGEGTALFAVILMVGAVGWAMNLYKLVSMIGDLGPMEIARLVGVIIAPLGAVLGFL